VRRRLPLVAAAFALLAGVLPALGPTAQAGPSTGGYSTSNVTYIKHIPFEVGSATGARTFKVKGHEYFLVTSWKAFSIYDLANPYEPTLIGTPHPFGFKFENEDVSTNGRIMLFSEELPQDILHVWDIQDLANPVEIATVDGGGGHTTSCIYDCKYSLSSYGYITDLRRPDQPKSIGNWIDALEKGSGVKMQAVHDLTEIAPGLVLTAGKPLVLIDFRKDVKHPTVLAKYAGSSDGYHHSVLWPRNGNDRFAFLSEESNFSGRCEGPNNPTDPSTENRPRFYAIDTTGWKTSHKLRDAGYYELPDNGVYVDGSPAVNAMGCSTHWFSTHPTFKDGGAVALGSYEHGTRFLTVSKAGKLKEQGWFVPWAGSTSAAYWIRNRLVYAVDYSRGIDVLQYEGPLKSG
jgi:hypothetical protein